MKGLFQKLGFKKENSDIQVNTQSQDKEFFKDIQEVQNRLDSVNSRYDLTSDNDLVESLIYEQRSLESRYQYLIKTAKEKGIKSNIKTRI